MTVPRKYDRHRHGLQISVARTPVGRRTRFQGKDTALGPIRMGQDKRRAPQSESSHYDAKTGIDAIWHQKKETG